MKGRRSFTDREEQRILRVVAESSALQHALVYLLLFTGFRPKEALSLRVGQVWKNNKVVPEIARAIQRTDWTRRPRRRDRKEENLCRVVAL